MRSLRTTIEHVVAAGASGQLALGRLHLQEQRLHVLMERLKVVQEQRVEVEREATRAQEAYARFETELKEFGTAVRAHHDDYAPSRETLESALKGQRRAVAMAVAEVHRLTAEEAGLVAEVATERARWSDVNRRLEDIERTLARQ